MNRLPPELLENIVTHCDHLSLKALRSTNHQWHDLTTPSVFSTIYIAPCILQQTLANLADLIHSPKALAQHITHLQVYTDILPAWDTNEYREIAVRHLQDEQALQRAWNAYAQLLDQQRDSIEYRAQHLQVLKELISSLPNLESAHLGIALPFQGSSIATWPVWKRLKRDILLSPDDWMYDDAADYRYTDIRMAQTTTFLLDYLEAIGFRASFAGIKQVREMKVEILQNGRLRSLMAGMPINEPSTCAFAPEVESRFQIVAAAFEHLTVLDLTVPHPVTETETRMSVEEEAKVHVWTGAEMSSILLRARNLQSLRFSYDSDAGTFWTPAEAAQHPLYSLLEPASGTSPWPHLAHVDLSINVPHNLLLSFLSLLSPTLKSLELRDMCVGDAQALIEGLPRVIQPDSIYLECLWTGINVRFANIHSEPTTGILYNGTDVDAPYERGVRAYLLGQAEDFPRLTDKYLLTDEELARLPPSEQEQ